MYQLGATHKAILAAIRTPLHWKYDASGQINGANQPIYVGVQDTLSGDNNPNDGTERWNELTRVQRSKLL
jgi:hypothetical protein